MCRLSALLIDIVFLLLSVFVLSLNYHLSSVIYLLCCLYLFFDPNSLSSIIVISFRHLRSVLSLSSYVNVFLSFRFSSVCFFSCLFVSFMLSLLFHMFPICSPIVCLLLPFFHHQSVLCPLFSACLSICLPFLCRISIFLSEYPVPFISVFVLPLICSLCCYISSVLYPFWTVFFNLS